MPDVRAAIESFCNLIAEGKADKQQVVDHSLTNFKNKFAYFTSHIERMDSLFQASFSPLAATGKFISKVLLAPFFSLRFHCVMCVLII